ncbi:MAG TPA: replicative DNA helicase [Acidimicrobiales bacterium]|nr:replicative DNA helicase [Acidimicrobiales bacterium]
MASLPSGPSTGARRGSRASLGESAVSLSAGAGSGSSISRIPPHSFEAEESLLGAMLLSRDAIAVAVEEVSADDFYKPSHAHTFGAITSLYARGEPADAVTVAEEMRRTGTLEASGGASALVSLQANTPAISSVSRYARIVQEHAILRRLIGVAYEIAELGYQLPTDVDAAVDHAEAMVFQVAQRRSSDSTRSLKDLLTESLDHLEYLANRDETITGVATGYQDLDHQLYGLQPSNLIVVGARPSMGKSAFALGLASHAARIGVPVLFFSLEMSHLELAQRVLCAEARVDAGRLRNGKLVESDWSKIAGAIGRIGTSPLYLDDNPNVTIMDIRAKARRMKSAEGGLGLVVVDYLQLMTGRTSAENRQVEISEISRGLKILARELQVPVVALSQLSRNLESRSDKRPMLADLRECLTADTVVARADSSDVTTIGEIARSGETNVPVWSLDADYQVVRSVMAQAWSTGIKSVFRIRLAGGQSLRATSNHPLLTPNGWAQVGELSAGDLVGVVPEPLPRETLRDDLAGGGGGVAVGVPVGVGAGVGAGHGSFWEAPGEGAVAVRAPARGTGRALAAEPGPIVEWERVEEIRYVGEQEVFDAYVPGTHCFVANGVVAHNSGAIEQDADVVMFIYRDEVYNPDSSDRGVAEILVAKHRNGPTGLAKLSFISNYARFGDLAKM